MIGIIIQARTGSTRLPGKILKMIGAKRLLEHILFRLSMLKHNVKVIIATTNTEKDDVVEEFCIKNHITCFRRNELNVLERYYVCAKQYNFDHIVRLTGDNPFTDIEELDNLIRLHLDSYADYSRSFAVLPKGVGAEIFTFKALETSHYKSSKPNHFEHVNEYIEENEAEYIISELTVPSDKNRPDLSLTVDTIEDYQKACFIVENSKNEYITTQEAIAICSQYV